MTCCESWNLFGVQQENWGWKKWSSFFILAFGLLIIFFLCVYVCDGLYIHRVLLQLVNEENLFHLKSINLHHSFLLAPAFFQAFLFYE